MKRGFFDGIFRIRYRLLLVNLLAVGVPLLGISFAHFYEREVLRALEEDMVHQALVLRQVLLTDPLGPRLPLRGPLLAQAARYTRTRIRLLDENGVLAADSHAGGPPEGAERDPGHLLGLAHNGYRHEGPPVPVETRARPEVQRALAGQFAAATRTWEHGDRVFLFGALPIVRPGGVQKPLGVVYVTRSTNPVRTVMHRIKRTLLGVLAVALSATIVMSLFLAATIARPLGRLTRIARRISEGDRTQSLADAGSDRRDEIGELARAFDVMARKLDERARYVGELAANISHEFKSPLTSIRGAAELLLDGAAEDPDARGRFLANILEDAQRLDRLVTRLLELSRVEADDAPREPLDFEALMRESVDEACRRGPAPIDLVWSASAKAGSLVGRRAHLASAIGNLLENAEQHAAPDSRITVSVNDLDHGLSVAVHNVGATPISEANLARIWDRFFTTRGAAGGTGLGLPIVKTVVAAHGGSVRCASSATEGTTFTVEIPLTGWS